MSDPRMSAEKDAAKREADRQEEQRRKAEQEALNNRKVASILGFEKAPAKRDKDEDADIDGKGFLAASDSEKKYRQYPAGTYECVDGLWGKVGKRDEYNKNKDAKYIVHMDEQGKITPLIGGIEASIDFLVKTQGATTILFTYSLPPGSTYSNGIEATLNIKKYVEQSLRDAARIGVGADFDDNFKAAIIHYYGISGSSEIFQLARSLKVNDKKLKILVELSTSKNEFDEQIKNFQENESKRNLTSAEVGNAIDQRIREIQDNVTTKIREEDRVKGVATDVTKVEKAVGDAHSDFINKELNELKEQLNKANGPLQKMGELFNNLDKINPADIVKARKDIDSYFTSSVISFFKEIMGSKEDYGTRGSEAKKISDRIDKRQEKRGKLLDEVDKELGDIKKRAEVWQAKIDNLLGDPNLTREKRQELEKLKVEYKKIADGITTNSKPGLDNLRSHNVHAKENFVKKHATAPAAVSSPRMRA